VWVVALSTVIYCTGGISAEDCSQALQLRVMLLLGGGS
jgi:hypothetical protein